MKTHHEDTASEIYGEYRCRNYTNQALHDGTAQEVADELEIDIDELKWAIEEYGRCDTEAMVAWKPGEPEKDENNERISGGGWEWPATESPTDPFLT